MKTINKYLGVLMLFSSSVVAQEVDDTYFFTTDREIPVSISADARLKPVVPQANTLASKYANPDFNGGGALEGQSFDYYSEDAINEQYTFGNNTLHSNPFGNPWAMNNFGPYSVFNDPFFSPHFAYGSRMGMGFGMNPWGNRFGMMSPWGWGGSRFGMNFGFNSMFANNFGMGWGMGNGFYDPFNPFFDPFMNPYMGMGFGRGFFGSPFVGRRAIVVERPTRVASKRFNRGNAPSFSRNANNAARMAAYRPSSDANRVASSRVRNVEQLQQRINNRNNGRLSSTSNSVNTNRSSYGRNSTYSSGRSSSNRRYSSPSNSFNSGRSSFSSPSYSSPRSSGGSRSSAPVRRGRQ